MRIYFLGTSSGVPATNRNVSGIALRFEQRSDWYLFECGEGTQHQILCSPLSLASLSKVFISHLHGDHWYGLPGLLASRSLQGTETPLNIWGPPGLKAVIETVLEASQVHLTYELTIHEIEKAGQTIEGENDVITTVELSHGVLTYGFVVREHDRPGAFNVAMAKELGIPEGPIYGRLKNGEVVTLDNGEVVDGSRFLGPPQRGRRIFLGGDNDRPRRVLQHMQDVDVLIHEATHTEAAYAKKGGAPGRHSTAHRIGTAAEAMSVPNLILTHFSPRYGDDPSSGHCIDEIRAEAANAYKGHLFIAEDHAEFELSREGELRRVQ